MKHSLILIIYCLSFLVSRVETKFNSSFSKENFGDTTVKTNLPFGSPVLIRHKFPRWWHHPGEDDADYPMSPNQVALDKLTSFYNYLNTLKSEPSLKPIIIKKIPIGDDSLIIEDKEKFIAKVTYQLPDLGPYKCYYQYDKQNHKELKSKDFKSYLEIGNLILYNQKNQQANILKIYPLYTGQDFLADHYRLFYINKNKIISIYNCWIGETEGYIKKTQTITVDSTGKIIIKNLK